MEKSRSVSTILVFFGLDLAPPSFRHARPRVRRPSGLDYSVLGPVSNSVVSDLFRKCARQEKKRNVPPRCIVVSTPHCGCGNPSSILGLDTMLRKASVARVDRRLRRYYLIVRLLPNVFALACLPLSSI